MNANKLILFPTFAFSQIDPTIPNTISTLAALDAIHSHRMLQAKTCKSYITFPSRPLLALLEPPLETHKGAYEFNACSHVHFVCPSHDIFLLEKLSKCALLLHQIKTNPHQRLRDVVHSTLKRSSAREHSVTT